MNIELREFQATAVGKFVLALRKAGRDARDGECQAVTLASPTGSGKTVMLIEAIERLLTGDEEHGPDPEATFLWVTDQPELNLQTRDKMLEFSTVLSRGTLTVVENDFDAERFAPGQVYFLNTQKLGKNSLLVAEGDRRAWSLWETIRNTAAARPGSFYVLIDEAHRGMSQSAQARNEANSIIQKFLVGSVEIPAIPLIVGISATPHRFTNLLNTLKAGGLERTMRTVKVEASDVRESGLIKDAVQFVHPTENQPSDMTLLRASVRSWQEYRAHWADYCAAQGEEPVRPLLAVQVADGTETQVSKTDLAEALGCIEAESGGLPPEAFAHAFDSHTEVKVGERTLRYLPPSEISADPDVQIVFFKTSLTTGWDCPRAETMMSFRTAADATYIAQLVGRMVRTPLVRRVEADEHLNTVALFLPHYNAKELAEVVKRLTDQESGLMPPTEVRTEAYVPLRRAADSDAVFEALSQLPHSSVPRATKPNEIRRAMKMGLRLSLDGLRRDAPDEIRERLLDVVDRAFNRVKDLNAFKSVVEERDSLDIRLVSYLYGEAEELGSQAQQIPVSPENIEDLFETAGRKIGEGLHRDWRARRCERDGADARRAKLEWVALANADLKRDLETEAKAQAKTWTMLYQHQIAKLPETKRQAYEDIQGLAGEPEPATLVFPDVIEAKLEGDIWERHLYVDEKGGFPAKLNEWEAPVLKAEFKRGIRAWLRVVPRKPWALAIPYLSGGKTKPVYVDFLVVREEASSLVVDILDPHTPSLGDAADKLAGLAEHAEKHGVSYGRIESIILENGEIRRLNLQDAAVRERAKRVQTKSDVEALFERMATS